MRVNWKTFFLVVLLMTSVLVIAACSGKVEESSKSEPTDSNKKASNQSTNDTSSEVTKDDPKEEYPNFPEREITIIVSNKAGGSNDLAARAIAGPLQEVLGVNVVVENVKGAGGNIARAQVYKSKPDGYTLLKTPMPSMAIGELVENGDFKTLEFEPVFNMFGNSSNVIVVPTTSPYQSIEDLIKASKGKKLTASGSGVATNSALGSIFLSEIGVEHQYIPFNGGSETVQQVAGAHVDFGIASEIASQSLVQDGKIRVIATTATERLSLFPDAPTLIELGYSEHGFEILYGIWAPPGTPQEIIEKLANAFLEASKDPTFGESAERVGFNEKVLMPSEFKEKRDASYKLVEKSKQSFGTGD
jgi:tripartite-type tricarboxylate transporter receptor subunit TctC